MKAGFETTLVALWLAEACEDRYAHLRAALGPDWPDDRPIPLLTILETNGLVDALWALRAVPDAEQLSRRLACDYAKRVSPILTAMTRLSVLLPPPRTWQYVGLLLRCVRGDTCGTDDVSAVAAAARAVACAAATDAADARNVELAWQERRLREMLAEQLQECAKHARR